MSELTALIFEIHREGALLRTESFSRNIIKIGQLPTSHLRLEDPDVSRIHAVVERLPDGHVSIIDLGSAGGTLVNGAIVGKTTLESGDEIRVGATRIVFRTPRDSNIDSVGAPPFADGITIIGAEGAGATAHDHEGPEPVGLLGCDLSIAHASSHVPARDCDSEWMESDKEAFARRFCENYAEGDFEVACLWNDLVLSVDQRRKPWTVTVGEASKNTLQIAHPSIPSETFPLIQRRGRDAILNFTDEMSGAVHVADRRYTLQEAVSSGLTQAGNHGEASHSLIITSETRVRVDIGDNTFLAHHTEPSGRVAIGGVAPRASFMAPVVVSGMLHAVFMFLVFFVPPDSDSLALDGFDLDNRFASQQIAAQEPEPEMAWLETESEEESATEGEKGKSGKSNADVENRKRLTKGPKDSKKLDVTKDTRIVEEKLADVGVTDRMLTSSWTHSNAALANQAISALGDPTGDKAGDTYGGFAFQKVGTGRDAGGVTQRGVGLKDGLGTKGRRGEGRDTYGQNVGQIEEPPERKPRWIPLKPTVHGALDRAIIRRVIRKRHAEVRYCYEKQLIKDKNLSGRVVVSFTISSTGRVVAALTKNSTLRNSEMERCLTSKVRRWVFPEPEGGGLVRVSYPFVFKSR